MEESEGLGWDSFGPTKVDIKEGMKLRAKWQGGVRYYEGVVKAVNGDDTYHIEYADGDVDEAVPYEHIKADEVVQTNRKQLPLIIDAFFKGEPLFRHIAGPPVKVKKFYSINENHMVLLEGTPVVFGRGPKHLRYSWIGYRRFKGIWWRVHGLPYALRRIW